MLVVEGASDRVAGVDADTKGVLLLEPLGQRAEESAGNSLPATVLDGVDPLEFGVALVAMREMARDKTHDLLSVDGNEGCSGGKRFLGRVGSVEVARDAVLPVGFGLPALRADGSHCWNVGGFDRSDGDWHVGTSILLRCLKE